MVRARQEINTRSMGTQVMVVGVGGGDGGGVSAWEGAGGQRSRKYIFIIFFA